MHARAVILFVVFSIFVAREGLACNPGWKLFSGKCYLPIENRLDIRIARRYCQVYGGDLSYIDSNQTFRFLKTLNQNVSHGYWVGENSTLPDSRTFNVTNPKSGCPYITRDDELADFLYSDCDDTKYFICEVEPNAEIECPTGWYLYWTTCYKPMPHNATFDEAADTCAIQGGTLAILDDIAREHEVAAVIIGRNTTFMVGAQENHNGTILWMTGKQFMPSCAECIISSRGKCLGFLSTAEHPVLFTWVHLDCESQHLYICEIPASVKPTTEPSTSPPPTTEPPTTPIPLQCPHGFNWKIHVSSGYCYWETTYETERLNWYQARKFCQNIGGDLATYQDEHQETVGLGGAKGHYRGLWFGLKKSPDNVFNWVDGSPLTYTNWDYDEPKLQSRSSFCAVHGANGSKWKLDYCGVRRWFVCKASKTRRVTIPDPITIFKKTSCNFTTPGFSLTNWYLFEDHCYLVRERSYTWYMGKDFCNDNGAHLVSVHSFEETDFIISLLSSISDRDYWSGLTVKGNGAPLEWSDGTPLDFMYWPDSDRRNKSREIFGLCGTVNSMRGHWSQTSCNSYKQVICKKPLNSSIELSAPEPTPELPGYCPNDWFPLGNKCYRIYGSRRSGKLAFDDALNACKEQNAELASIHSEEELDFIVDISISSEAEAWIGLKEEEDNVFHWTDGSPLDYSKWDQSYYSSVFTCVFLGSEKGSWKWYHSGCSVPKPYVCQKAKDPSLTEPSKNPFECTNITGWYKLRENCYGVFENQSVSWVEAQRKCKEFGADLATLQDSDAGTFLKKRLTPNNFHWIGVRKQNGESYGLVTGKVMMVSNWLSSPREVGPLLDNCVTLNPAAKWVVKNCKEQHDFICQLNNGPDSAAEEDFNSKMSCPQSRGWTDLKTDFCYIFTWTVERTWLEAMEFCFIRGGHLASFHSEQELSTVKLYLERYYNNRDFYIGLAQRFDGTYSWVDGSPVDFINWDPNRDPNKCCGRMSVPSGLWFTVPRDSKVKGTICSIPKEKDVSTDFLKLKEQDGTASKLTIGGIFGILICLLVVVAIVAVGVYYICPPRRKRVPLEENDSL